MGNQWGEDEDLMLGEMRRSQTFGECTVIVSHVDRMMCFDQSSVIVWIDSVRHTHTYLMTMMMMRMRMMMMMMMIRMMTMTMTMMTMTTTMMIHT